MLLMPGGGGLVQPAPLAARDELQLDERPPPLTPDDRARLVRRARHLAWIGNAWHSIEFAIAVSAGIAAGSVALIGFGADALIEALGGFIILWRFSERRARSELAERRAQQLVAVSYAVLVAYILVESLRTVLGGHHPDTSWVGIALAAFAASTMPLLALAKRLQGRCALDEGDVEAPFPGLFQ